MRVAARVRIYIYIYIYIYVYMDGCGMVGEGLFTNKVY